MSLGVSGLEGRDMVDIRQTEDEANGPERRERDGGVRRRENDLTLLINTMGRVN